MKPKTLEKLVQLANQWKEVLEKLVPESYVEIAEGIKGEKLFTWFFENRRPNNFKQSIQMDFYKSGKVVVNTQSGENLENLDTFAEAEAWIAEYFKIPESLSKPTEMFNDLPEFSKRNEASEKWFEFLKKFEPYGLQIYTESEHRPFNLYLPTLESVLRNDGQFEHEDDSIDLDPGKDWAKIISEKVIEPLKEMYAFSATEIPNFDQELNNFQLHGNAKKLYYDLDGWITWIQTISKKVPFKMHTRDIWSALSCERYHFEDGKVVTGIKVGRSNGIMVVPFYHEYQFNGDQSPIKAFSGKLYFFEENVAVLEFSGTSLWGMKFREETFHLYGRYAGAKGEPVGFVAHRIPEIGRVFVSGTWVEVAEQFIKLVESIDELLGEGMRVLPEVVKASQS